MTNKEGVNQFTEFIPFIKTDNLPQGFSPSDFIFILDKLHNKTGKWWGQGNCAHSPKVTFFLGLLLKENHLDMLVRTWTLDTKHSWPQISAPGYEIVVDPFGFFENTFAIAKIEPYFGNLVNLDQSSHPVAWETYHYGRPLSQLEEVGAFLASKF